MSSRNHTNSNSNRPSSSSSSPSSPPIIKHLTPNQVQHPLNKQAQKTESAHQKERKDSVMSGAATAAAANKGSRTRQAKGTTSPSMSSSASNKSPPPAPKSSASSSSSGPGGFDLNTFLSSFSTAAPLQVSNVPVIVKNDVHTPLFTAQDYLPGMVQLQMQKLDIAANEEPGGRKLSERSSANGRHEREIYRSQKHHNQQPSAPFLHAPPPLPQYPQYLVAPPPIAPPPFGQLPPTIQAGSPPLLQLPLAPLPAQPPQPIPLQLNMYAPPPAPPTFSPYPANHISAQTHSYLVHQHQLAQLVQQQSHSIQPPPFQFLPPPQPFPFPFPFPLSPHSLAQMQQNPYQQPPPQMFPYPPPQSYIQHGAPHLPLPLPPPAAVPQTRVKTRSRSSKESVATASSSSQSAPPGFVQLTPSVVPSSSSFAPPADVAASDGSTTTPNAAPTSEEKGW